MFLNKKLKSYRTLLFSTIAICLAAEPSFSGRGSIQANDDDDDTGCCGCMPFFRKSTRAERTPLVTDRDDHSAVAVPPPPTSAPVTSYQVQPQPYQPPVVVATDEKENEGAPDPRKTHKRRTSVDDHRSPLAEHRDQTPPHTPPQQVMREGDRPEHYVVAVHSPPPTDRQEAPSTPLQTFSTPFVCEYDDADSRTLSVKFLEEDLNLTAIAEDSLEGVYVEMCKDRKALKDVAFMSRNMPHFERIIRGLQFGNDEAPTIDNLHKLVVILRKSNGYANIRFRADQYDLYFLLSLNIVQRDRPMLACIPFRIGQDFPLRTLTNGNLRFNRQAIPELPTDKLRTLVSPYENGRQGAPSEAALRTLIGLQRQAIGVMMHDIGAVGVMHGTPEQLLGDLICHDQVDRKRNGTFYRYSAEDLASNRQLITENPLRVAVRTQLERTQRSGDSDYQAQLTQQSHEIGLQLASTLGVLEYISHNMPEVPLSVFMAITEAGNFELAVGLIPSSGVPATYFVSTAAMESRAAGESPLYSLYERSLRVTSHLEGPDSPVKRLQDAASTADHRD